MKKIYIYPPFGYQWNDGKGVDSDNLEEMRVCASNLFKDAIIAKEVKEAKKEDLIKFFKNNGFIFIKC